MKALIVILVLAPVILVSGQRKANGSRSFHSQKLGIAFKYPSQWKVTETESGVSLEVPDNAYSKRYPRDVTANVSIKDNDDARCRPTPSQDFEPSGKVRKLRLGSNTFYMLSSFEGAAGNSYWDNEYSTFKTGKCYSVGLNYHTVNDRNAWTFDLDTIFNGILRSMSFGK